MKNGIIRRNVYFWGRVALLALAFALALGLCAARAEIVYSGICGDNLTWALDDQGVLTISGTGEMFNYSYSNTPWGTSVKQAIIEDSITSIGDSAFFGCRNLTNITIPDSVASIGNSAFCDCSSLTSITIPEGVTSIGNSAFADCRSLTSITIPEGVTSIGSDTFFYCRSLTSITIPEGVTSIGSFAFWACFSLTDITIPESVTSIGLQAFLDCRSLTSITIPKGVTSIGDCAFCNCSALTSITIPDSVTSIGEGAFSECSRLTSVTVGTCGSNAYNWAKDHLTCEIRVNRHQAVVDPAVPPTCTEPGLTKGSHCPGCGTVFEPQEVVCCLKHVTIIDPAVPPTCTEPGLTKGSHCARCGAILEPQEVVCCLKHVTIIDPAVQPTCTEEGLTKGSHCARCGEVLIPQEVIPKLPHTPIIDPEIPATATHLGLTEGSHCAVCGEILVPQMEMPLWSVGETDGGVVIQKYNGDEKRVIVPKALDGAAVKAIADGAFTGIHCPILVYIPDYVISIGVNAFDSAVTVYCNEYSEADFWGDERGYVRVYTDDADNGDFYIVDMPSALTLEYGKNHDMGAVVWPMLDGTVLIWNSDNALCATVEDGTVTAHQPGKATITLRVGAVTADMAVTVWALPEDFALSQAELYILSKKTAQLEIVDVVPMGADFEITWTSSNDQIATVSADGLVTAKRIGTTTITATSQNGISVCCEVHVCYPVDAIAFDPETASLIQGQSFQLTANVTARTQTFVNKLVSFSSSDEAVAAVDQDGVVTAIGTGTATITAVSDDGVSATCEVTVREAAVLTLPADLTTIEEEAFMGDLSLESVIIPDGCQSIGPRAFAGCANLVYVRIPTGTDVASDAFEGCDNVVIDYME